MYYRYGNRGYCLASESYRRGCTIHSHAERDNGAGDHGFQLGEKERREKFSLWERATRVNLVWVAPGVTKPGSTCGKPVNLLDVYPTLASLTGCEPTERQLEGNDLSALMKNLEASWDKTSLTTYGYKNYSIRSERYRYIVYADGTEELYDHEKDKWEWNNLADSPEYDDIKEMMRKGIPDHHEPVGASTELSASKSYAQ
ncbi:MAG: sulfatase/phosphatase domain-containing protein [Candidatus Hydrogenedentota bacterium]